MQLRELQCLLVRLYGIDVEADVRDYLVTDANALAGFEQSGAARDTDEKLLIEEGDGELGLALYLDPELVERLLAMDPAELFRGRNLADYCLALEGVSHFNYVAWNAALDKRVTLLELEMQAEIDKYLSVRTLVTRPPGGEGSLLGRLFGTATFDTALGPEELGRYADAWALAASYCRSLEARFPAGPPATAMLREVRSFFRWPQPAKISHIRSAALT